MEKLKKWSKSIIAVLAIVFVLCNVYLLLKENSKAERTINVRDWTRVEKDNVKKLFYTKGVTEPESETHVYFDKRKGSLDKILVKEGEMVTAGTPLFVYDAQKLEDKKAVLEDRKERLQSEMSSVENEITELQQIKQQAPVDTAKTETENKKVKVDVNIDTSPIIDSNVQQKIAAAQTEKSKLEATLTENDAKLSRIDEQLQDLNVVSPVDGQVTNINPELQDPMITIASASSAVKGNLPATRVHEVQEGQAVKLYSPLLDQYYTGEVSQVIAIPDYKTAKKEPMYSFLVKLGKESDNSAMEDTSTDEPTGITSEAEENTTETSGNTDAAKNPDKQSKVNLNNEASTVTEKEKPLLLGTKMDMQVTLAEALQVPVIASKSIEKENKKYYVYQMTKNGMVRKQPIQIGVSYKKKNQVIEGILTKDTIVTNEQNVKVSDPSPFITPSKSENLNKKDIKALPSIQKAKYILIGLFE